MVDIHSAVRVWETTTDTSSPFDLAGASAEETGLRTFVGAGLAGKEVFIMEQHQTANEWQLSRATITDAAPDTYVINQVIKSSNSDAQVAWSAGTRDVFLIDYHGYSPGPQHVITGALTLDESHYEVICNFSSGLTVTLPPVTDYQGKEYFVKSINSGAVTIAEDAGDSNSVEGLGGFLSSSISLGNSGQGVHLRSNGTAWRILGSVANQDLTTDADVQFAALHLGTLITNVIAANAATINLDAANDQKIDLAAATGAVTLTLTATAGQVRSGKIELLQDSTARDITWVAGTGITTGRWLGTEPTWSADTASRRRVIDYLFNGTDILLSVSEEETTTF